MTLNQNNNGISKEKKGNIIYNEFNLIDYLRNSNGYDDTLNYIIDDIKVGLSPRFSDESFSNEEKTIKLLKKISNQIESIIIGINGVEFSSNISSYDANSVKNTFLEKRGIDGIIINGIRDINEKITLLLGIADCAGIVGVTNDGNCIFNLHGGYKGILGAKDGGVGILANFVEEIYINGYKPEDLILYISPMAGSDFELPREYIGDMFNVFHETQISENKKNNFNFTDFYTNTKKEVNGEQKGNFDLRKLILNILDVYGFKNICYTNINTTDPNNPFAGHRLYSNGNTAKKGRLAVGVSNK